MKIFYLALSFIFVLGCHTTSHVPSNTSTQAVVNKIPIREHSIQAVLWQQRSAEYKALCYQAFNLAKLQIDNILTLKKYDGKSLAIITDIDETLINNSPFNAKLIEMDGDYTKEKWVKWGKLEKAKAVPGALEFLKYAKSKGVDIYYISNRYIVQQKETMANLKKIGFPFIDDEHILLKTKTSGKEVRRNTVLKDKTVVMLLGDNLSDFADVFDNKSTTQRNKITDKFKNEFGKKFIVFPNPMYGDWETKGIYERNYKWTPAQKDSIRRAKLISY